MNKLIAFAEKNGEQKILMIMIIIITFNTINTTVTCIERKYFMAPSHRQHGPLYEYTNVNLYIHTHTCIQLYKKCYNKSYMNLQLPNWSWCSRVNEVCGSPHRYIAEECDPYPSQYTVQTFKIRMIS